MNKSLMLAVLFALGGMLGAEDTPPQIENFKGRYAPVTIDGSRAFESQAPMTLTAKEPIEVDPAKTYQLKGEFKAASPGSSFLYFGLIPYDADMREIKAQNINVLPGTLTELSEAATQGARTIRIRNAANWKCVPARFYAAFGADKAHRDLPNFNVIPIKAVNGNEITLSAPLPEAYPAGTCVRMHRAGSSAIYSAAANRALPAEWTTFSGKIKGSGFHPKGGEYYDRFRPGTVLVAPVIYFRKAGKETGKVYFRNLTLTELK